MDRRLRRAWYLYDWANSAFATTVMAAVLPPYFAAVAAADLPPHLATAAWGYASSGLLLLAALLAPVVGAWVDRRRAAGLVLAVAVAAGALGTLALAAVGRGEWRLLLLAYGVAFLGFAAASVVYDSLLLVVAKPEERDRVSSNGFAWGYAGGGLLLALHALWIARPGWFGFADAAIASRAAFASVALWWAAFTVPLVRRAPTLPRISTEDLRSVFRRLRDTVSRRQSLREAWKFLLAFWLYNDAIGTVIKMASIYGASLGFGTSHLVGALLLVQLLAVPATLAAAPLARRFGSRACILAGLATYVGIVTFGFFMSRPEHFWILAGLVAMVQGGVQALSRSFFTKLIPADRAGELFGFYTLSTKFAGLIGPLLFAAAAQWTGESRWGALALVPLLVGGGILLATVRSEPEAG